MESTADNSEHAPQIITALRFQKRNQERVNVYLNGAYAFALPALDAAKLRKGQQLSQAEIQSLRLTDLQAKGYERAIRFLGVRPRSEWEVRQNLLRYRIRGDERLTEGHIEAILERLRDQRYVDDDAFARYWVEQRNQFKPMSPRALSYELRQKGVDARIIERVVTAEVEPEEAALHAARKQARRYQHLDPETFRKKMAGFLQRRGFAWPVVQETLHQVWQEIAEEIEEE
jgi:regulatory protein